jgi:hypothetical protein
MFVIPGHRAAMNPEPRNTSLDDPMHSHFYTGEVEREVSAADLNNNLVTSPNYQPRLCNLVAIMSEDGRPKAYLFYHNFDNYEDLFIIASHRRSVRDNCAPPLAQPVRGLAVNFLWVDRFRWTLRPSLRIYAKLTHCARPSPTYPRIRERVSYKLGFGFLCFADRDGFNDVRHLVFHKFEI